jgi:histidine triad (HIT) family protein
VFGEPICEKVKKSVKRKHFLLFSMKSDCVFCGIVAGTVPSSKVYEDDQVIVINDISPKAKVHQLIIPKRHIDSISDISELDTPLMGHMIMVAKKMAEEAGLKGYKLLLNVNKEGGQMVFHIHMHLLGGGNIKIAEC